MQVRIHENYEVKLKGFGNGTSFSLVCACPDVSERRLTRLDHNRMKKLNKRVKHHRVLFSNLQAKLEALALEEEEKASLVRPGEGDGAGMQATNVNDQPASTTQAAFHSNSPSPMRRKGETPSPGGPETKTWKSFDEFVNAKILDATLCFADPHLKSLCERKKLNDSPKILFFIISNWLDLIRLFLIL